MTAADRITRTIKLSIAMFEEMSPEERKQFEEIHKELDIVMRRENTLNHRREHIKRSVQARIENKSL